MSRRALCWLAVAVALSVCHDGLGYDEATWPSCTAYNKGRVVNREEANSEITDLRLMSCNITSLKSNELVYSNLKSLYLAYNNIEFIETSAFDSLSRMKYLYLNNNRLLGKDLPSSLFRNCHNLYYIEFSNNNMSGTPADLLQGLNNLDHLHCNNCSLDDMPKFITRSRLPIKRLHLNHNKLTRLDDPETFVNLSNLDVLKLKFNEIDNLHENLLKPLTDIQDIDMRSNKIRRIPEQLFQNKSQLWYINLSNNLINYVPEKAFIGTKLGLLRLNNNKLVYLSDNIIPGLSGSPWGRPQIYFDDNPLPCACLNKLLVKVKQLNIGYKRKDYDGKHKNCVMLDNFKCLG